MPFTGDHTVCISTFKAQLAELRLFESLVQRQYLPGCFGFLMTRKPKSSPRFKCHRKLPHRTQPRSCNACLQEKKATLEMMLQLLVRSAGLSQSCAARPARQKRKRKAHGAEVRLSTGFAKDNDLWELRVSDRLHTGGLQIQEQEWRWRSLGKHYQPRSTDEESKRSGQPPQSLGLSLWT